MIKKTSNKYTSFILTIVFVAMISIVLIIAVMDAENKKLVDEKNSQYPGIYSELQATINKLNDSIKDLGTDLKKAQDTAKKQAELIEQLKQLGVNNKDFAGATESYDQKYLELAAVLPEFEARVDERGIDIDETLVYDKNYFEYTRKLQSDAFAALSRALTVADQDKIIADFKKALEDMPTRVEKIYSALDTLEKDGITLSDEEHFAEVIRLFTYIPVRENGVSYTQIEVDSLFKIGEKKTLIDRFNADVIQYVPVVTSDFIAQIDALPKYLSINNEKMIKKAEEDHAYIKAFFAQKFFNPVDNEDALRTYNLATKLGTDFYRKWEKLKEYRVRLDELLLAKAAADVLNAEVAKYDTSRIKPNMAILAELNHMQHYIEEWENNPAFNIVTDSEAKDYVADNYEMVQPARDALKGYFDIYHEKDNGLAGAVNTLITAVNNIATNKWGAICPDSQKSLDAAIKAWETMWKAISALKDSEVPNIKNLPSKTDEYKLDNAKYDLASKEIDEILGFTGENKDNGLVAALAKVRADKKTYDYIVGQMAILDEFLNKTIHTVIHDAKCAIDPKTGKCKCTKLSTNYDANLVMANLGKLADMDILVYNLMVTYELEEEDFDADNLDKLKEIRLLEAYTDVVALIKAKEATFTKAYPTDPKFAFKVLAENKAAELLEKAEEIFNTYYFFDPKVERVEGSWEYEYVGVGVWSDYTNANKIAFKNLIRSLDEEFTFDNLEITNPEQ